MNTLATKPPKPKPKNSSYSHRLKVIDKMLWITGANGLAVGLIAKQTVKPIKNQDRNTLISLKTIKNFKPIMVDLSHLPRSFDLTKLDRTHPGFARANQFYKDDLVKSWRYTLNDGRAVVRLDLSTKQILISFSKILGAQPTPKSASAADQVRDIGLTAIEMAWYRAIWPVILANLSQAKNVESRYNQF